MVQRRDSIPATRSTIYDSLRDNLFRMITKLDGYSDFGQIDILDEYRENNLFGPEHLHAPDVIS